MKHTFLVFGKPQPHIRQWIDSYEKKLKRFGAFNCTILKERCFRDGGRETLDSYLKNQSVEIEKRLPKNRYLIILDEKGCLHNSHSFQKWFEKISQVPQPIFWVVGGAYGVHSALKKKATSLLSMTALSLTHDLAFIILLEQLLRTNKALSGESYAK